MLGLEAVLGGHPQLHCAQAVVLCTNGVHSPCLEAVMCLGCGKLSVVVLRTEHQRNTE